MIAIIKYNAGNGQSVENAVRRLGYPAVITENPELLQSSEKVIFPGVGEARSAMQYLSERGLDKVIQHLTQPVLGICLGLQLLCQYSEEGNVPCLNIFGNRVARFRHVRITPHMGWNSLHNLQGTLFKGVSQQADVYFVHNYYAGVSADTIAECHYGSTFSAALAHKNFYAVQFHPEKSAKTGATILKNFLEL